MNDLKTTFLLITLKRETDLMFQGYYEKVRTFGKSKHLTLEQLKKWAC